MSENDSLHTRRCVGIHKCQTMEKEITIHAHLDRSTTYTSVVPSNIQGMLAPQPFTTDLTLMWFEGNPKALTRTLAHQKLHLLNTRRVRLQFH